MNVSGLFGLWKYVAVSSLQGKEKPVEMCPVPALSAPQSLWYNVIMNPQRLVVVIPHAFTIVNILCIPSP